MFNCHVCGHNAAKSELVSEVFNLDGRRVLVERIPALVCEHCGEATFSRETTERIRRMVHGAGRPVKTVPMDVFAMARGDREADGLYLDLGEAPAAESEEISPGVILDYNASGKVVGIEVLYLSKRVSPDKLGRMQMETVGA